MNRLKRKFKVQSTPTKQNLAEPGWDGTYNPNTSSDTTLYPDPAHIQPPYPYSQTPSHIQPAPQGFYYQQQPGLVFMPMPVNVAPLSPSTGMPYHSIGHERPDLNAIDVSYQQPNGTNLATPMASYPLTPSHNGQDDHMHHKRSASTSTGHHGTGQRLSTDAGPRFPQPYPLSPISPNSALLMSDLGSLKRYDLVFLVSDSPSMGQNGKWTKCGELLGHLARVSMQYDSDGVEIHFLNTDAERSDDTFSSEEDVETMFQSVVSPEGSSRLTDKLDLLVSEYRGQLKKYIEGNPVKPWRTRPVPKKAIYVVLTDGNHADAKKIVDVISDMAGFLKSIQAPSTQFGIEFVQIGDDSDFDWLHRVRYQDEKVRGITGVDSYSGGPLDDVHVGTMLLRPVSGDNN